MPEKIAIFGAAFERLLEAERSQLPLWFVVAFGAGIGAWFALPGPAAWIAAAAILLGLVAAGLVIPETRAGRCLFWGGFAALAGLVLVWWRAERVAAPVLGRPVVATFAAEVEHVEPRAAKDDVRLTLSVAAPGMPSRVRVTLANDKMVDGMGEGARIRVRARLQSPPPMALPGTHDFARDLWFQGIGAIGKALDPPQIEVASGASGLDAFRDRLGQRIRERLGSGGEGGIATALATGDQAAIDENDADAMRRSGLAHLLSVSGLHIAAVVGAAMLLTLRLLALSERLALRFNLVLVSAGAGAVAGIGYTLLTGMQVPTVRSCIAAMLVLAGIALGREAFSLRLVAVGALAVLLMRPESIVGASFQLSFAAVTSIIAFHGTSFARRWFLPRDEGLPMRLLRSVVGLVATGLVVEFALVPFALYHFHKAGLYGVAANLVVIPLTTFVIMPLEAAALLLDPVGLGGPFWTACGWALSLLLGIAHRVADAPGAVAVIPSMPLAAFAAMVVGGAWLCLWRTRWRLWGLGPIAAGALSAAASPAPDLLVTGDGRHLALVGADGTPVLLRGRSGDFIQSLMSEASAYDGDPEPLDEQRFARCSRDACVVDLERGGRAWRILAVRSRDRITWTQLTRACHDADIVVAERRLPRGCKPRWLKLDGETLARTGGVAIRLDAEPEIDTVALHEREHPWAATRPMPKEQSRPTSSGGSVR